MVFVPIAAYTAEFGESGRTHRVVIIRAETSRGNRIHNMTNRPMGPYLPERKFEGPTDSLFLLYSPLVLLLTLQP